MGIIEIPIGPQHPALKEPASFKLYLEGERIAASNVTLGYNHRGVEKACEARTYIEDLYLIERVCGICSHSHSTCFISAVEEVAKLEVPKRAKYIRTIIGELERVHSHLLWLGVAAHEIGFDTLFMYSWRDREVVMDTLEMLSGNRVNYGINKIGGVRRDISEEQKEKALKAVDALEERTKYYIEIVNSETTLIGRLKDVGKLSYEDAMRLHAAGPTARASGVDRDVRRDDPYLVYDEIPFNVITDNHCDVLGRTIVRVKELIESYKIIRFALNNIPQGDIAVRSPRRIPAGEAFSRYEAPRGEDVHYVRGNGTDKPERVKLRAPTLANFASITYMLNGGYLADAPIVIAAIDPCFSCTDRSISIKHIDSGKENIMDWESLRQYSIDWHKNRGFNAKNIQLKVK
ncbi:MAG TPA: nickel-dependent hydrogenase large subunit [Bacteroidales bacterium]|nr:nickel-dependent hydrogenase large subunit [Bacteroidales bacterium]HCI54288.1 NADH dehydrogenase subunit [Bacteroidales bacterium]HOU96599.1 nickel-dependent hydrogenase large subunit [Bacteroidales bacterium]HQG35842.1 nickel-dependent hydrogenase large subunit [Bacteroidales bacterium]HQG53312.1 nickel-dependent hydrogenase large subunit [Bacteroidales bacterium]